MGEECSPKCVSRKHADKIVSAIINGYDFEENVVKLLPTCYNVATNKDSLGRTPLQVAATFGRMKILNWLLLHDANVHAKDEESGYSALHRAFYFGQLQSARALLQSNANLFQPVDNENMSPFDHLIRDRSNFKALDPNLPCEVYVWGTNSNYSLGVEKQSSPEFPELLDAFPKESGSVKQVAMSKFHSVFVTSAGQAFSCGIGQGGKLGLGSEVTVIGPQKICIEVENCLNSKVKKSTTIIQAALGTDHTLLLTEAGNVLSFGMNQYHQLGHTPPPTQLVAPKFLKAFEDKIKGAVIVGVCASRFHSVFWCSNSVYTCGLNAGALGHVKGEKTIVLPKRVPSLSVEAQLITHVTASDGATAIATKEGNVYVLHEYQCRKIASKQFDLTKVVMAGGKLDFVEEDLVIDTTPFQVLILSKTGKLNIWSQANPVLTRCSFRLGHDFAVQDVALCKNSIILVSREGEVFIGTLGPQIIGKKTKMETQLSPVQIVSRVEYPKRDQFIQVHIKRVPGIHRATTVVCDPVGKNFAVTHIHPSAPMGDVAKIIPPPSQFKSDLKQLLDNADLSDLTHDVVFHVGFRSFAAHRFVLATNCYTFYRDVCMSSSSFKNDNKTVHISDVPAGIFQLFLEFIYTGTCALFETETSTWNLIIPAEVLCVEKNSLSENSEVAYNTTKEGKRKTTSGEGCGNDRDEILRIRIVQAYAKKLGILKLGEILEKAHLKNNVLLRNDRVSFQPKTCNRFSGEDFYDTIIQSEDGKELNVHRAVLVARSDYFRSMFGCAWIESMALKTVPLPIHSLVLEVILDYIYEDKAVKIETSEDVDWVGNCLVVADLLLIPRLVSICESALVGLLTIKNVGKILEFATLYSAAKLKASCMYFICYNLPAVVELRIWNCLSEEVMSELTQFYQQFHGRIACRLQIPFVSKEMAEAFLNIDEITESLADARIHLSSFNREKEVKRKKPRRKTGKKGSDSKDQSLHTSTPLADASKLITGTAAVVKEEVWSKVNKPKKRNKSLSIETPLKEYDSGSPTTKVQNQEDNKILIEESRDGGLLAQNITPTKQNNLTLFEIATVVQAAISPENQKCKRFPKLSQKQRKMQDITQISSTSAVTVPSPWKSCNTSLETSESLNTSITSADGSTSSPLKVHSVWKSPNKSDIAPVNEVEEKFVPLQEIIVKERLQRQTLNKISTKPLKLTLIEDKAIDDLRKFYGADIVDEEYIVVERVLPLEAGVPIWSKKTTNKSNTKLRSLSMSDSGI